MAKKTSDALGKKEVLLGRWAHVHMQGARPGDRGKRPTGREARLSGREAVTHGAGHVTQGARLG